MLSASNATASGLSAWLPSATRDGDASQHSAPDHEGAVVGANRPGLPECRIVQGMCRAASTLASPAPVVTLPPPRDLR